MITRIYVLESIPTDEPQTGRELYNDTISRYCQFYAPDLLHSHTTIKSKMDLIGWLNTIENEVLSTDEIVLHIEAHGATDKTSMVLSNGDSISWKELETYLIRINLKTKNKLHLHLATCFGMHVAFEIGKTLNKTAPYKSFTASLYALKPVDIIADNNLLYEEIIRQRQMYKAFETFDKRSPETTMRTKDVETVLGQYIRYRVESFLSMDPSFDVVMFFNVWCNLKMDYTEFNSFETIQEKSNYVFESLATNYFPNL
ncbi:hypothetical protein [Fluviicola sp.]|uniref:hypothetical protein n=1 Tax=Fluviicola sp. TaxID=1917219 RepID=UPI00260501F6|nr:hypothetical protein [Fluviicola sp.]